MKLPITQEDSYGCGIACVAFICGVSYKAAKHNYFEGKKAGTRGYLCKDLVYALSITKKKYKYSYIKRRTSFKENTIVFIKRSKRYPIGHYLVRVKNSWMDPWLNFDATKPEIKKAKSGFRKKLPDRAIYKISPN